MMSNVEQYPNALTHAGSKGVHSSEIYSYLHAKMKKFHDQYQLNLKSSDPNVKDTAKQTFKNDIEVFLKEVGRAFLEEDISEPINDVNKDIRKIVTDLNRDVNPDKKPFSFFCQP